MMNNWIKFAFFSAAFCVPALSFGQAMPTAVSKGMLQVGGGWSYVEPDYGQKAIQGVTGFGDFDFRPHLGVEAEFHYVSLITPTDLGEISALIGPRFVLPRNHYDLYAKVVAGIGDIDIQEIQDNPQGGAGKYLAYGVGAGIDYKIGRHLIARGDFEYQHWSYLTGLTPSAITVGIAYRFR
jgi:opacity protein-like surface antigen